MTARPALLLVASLLLAACGGDGEAPKASSEPTARTTPAETAEPAVTTESVEPVAPVEAKPVDCGLVSEHDPSHQGMEYGVTATGVECDEAFILFAEAEFDETAKNFRMPGWTCSHRDNGSMEYSYDCVNGDAKISRD